MALGEKFQMRNYGSSGGGESGWFGDLFCLFICLFIYFWLRWVFVAVGRLSIVAVSRGYYSLQYVGFSLRRLLLLRSIGSRHTGFSACGTQALEHRLSSCGAQA